MDTLLVCVGYFIAVVAISIAFNWAEIAGLVNRVVRVSIFAICKGQAAAERLLGRYLRFLLWKLRRVR